MAIPLGAVGIAQLILQIIANGGGTHQIKQRLYNATNAALAAGRAEFTDVEIRQILTDEEIDKIVASASSAVDRALEMD